MSNLPPTRKYHYMRQNHESSAPSSILFIDCESFMQQLIDDSNKVQQHTLRMWCATYVHIKKGEVEYRRELKGYTAKEFWRCIFDGYGTVLPLLRNDRPLWIYAHNVAYDLTMLDTWKLFDDGTLVMKQVNSDLCHTWSGFACIDGPPNILKCRMTNTKKTIIFCDSLNYFRCPLAELGKSVGLDKLEMPTMAASDDKWFEYCRRDVDVLEKAMLGLMALVQEHDLGHWRYTAPSQAMAAYRHRFMKPKQILIHADENACRLERDAYYGGKVQIFYVGDVFQSQAQVDMAYEERPERSPTVAGPIYCLDIQSFYPSIMKTCYPPSKLYGYYKDTSKWNWNNVLAKYIVFAKVDLDADNFDYPIRRDEYSVMARGKITTTLAHPEFIKAYKEGHIRKVYDAALYTTDDLFSEYVNFFWNLRTEYKQCNKPEMAELAKIFLNSLIGKFGEKAIKWEEVKDVFAPKPWCSWKEFSPLTNQFERYRSIAWMPQQLLVGGETDNSFPAIPAYITSQGRAIMGDVVGAIGRDNCFYSDTDSLHVNQLGYDAMQSLGLVRDNSIGQFRLTKVARFGQYRGLKDYTLEGQRTIAGVSKSATEVANNVFEQTKFPKLWTILRSGSGYDMITRTERITRVYLEDKVRVGKDGRVYPIIMEDW